jgi:hypothetical protein
MVIREKEIGLNLRVIDDKCYIVKRNSWQVVPIAVRLYLDKVALCYLLPEKNQLTFIPKQPPQSLYYCNPLL